MSNSFIPTVDIFHFLVERLRITPESEELEKKFKQYDREHPDESYLDEMEDFANQENDKDEGEVYTENTYNRESSLSQGLQYTIFHKNDKTFVILQIHGGADIRGGYTEPYIFEIDDETSLLDDDIIYAYADDKYWSSDDGGYNWYFEGSTYSDEKGQGKPSIPTDIPIHHEYPKSWEITKEGVFYKPTGEPISFSSSLGGPEYPQWWHSNPRLVARWAPTLDKKQRTLRKRQRA